MKALLYVPLVIIAGIALVFASGFLLAFFGVMLLLGIAFWACGAKVKVKESGREIGYIRWFTFHRYDHNGLAGPFELTRRK